MTNDEIVVLYKKCKNKNCSRYGENLPLTEFYKDKKGKYGVRSKCKECVKKQNSEYVNKNKEKYCEYQKKHYKIYKEKIRKRHKKYREKNLEACREMCKNSVKEWRGKNKEKVKIYAHIRKSRIIGNGGSFNFREWEDCLMYFEGKCAYSGEILHINEIHIEHIVPISKGGANYIWNICPAKDKINLSKHNLDMEEWYRKQPYFSEERLNKIYKWMDYAKSKYGQAVA